MGILFYFVDAEWVLPLLFPRFDPQSRGRADVIGRMKKAQGRFVLTFPRARECGRGVVQPRAFGPPNGFNGGPRARGEPRQAWRSPTPGE